MLPLMIMMLIMMRCDDDNNGAHDGRGIDLHVYRGGGSVDHMVMLIIDLHVYTAVAAAMM
jgi:hypothetical protein